MAEDMVAKVAKALGDHLYGYVDPTETPATWAMSIATARLAIAAMREPTEGMLEAGLLDLCSELPNYEFSSEEKTRALVIILRAMIDAALGDAKN